MPGPGTAVVIVQREGDENFPRVGRMTGRAGAVSAASRPDLPPLKYDEPVILLARVANQKMMASGVYTGPQGNQDSFRLAGAWSPSDNRADPRLPVQIKAEVRPVGVRATLPVVIKDLSAGGAKLEMAKGSISGEVDLLVRYGGFSATLPAFVLCDMATIPVLAALSDPGEQAAEEESAERSSDSADVKASTASEVSGSPAEGDTAEATGVAGAGDEGTDHDATERAQEPTAIGPAAESAAEDDGQVLFIPQQDAPAEYRLQFGDLNLPQQGFLRHMLRDLAEISGWELAS